jgi:hypothetical protein
MCPEKTRYGALRKNAYPLQKFKKIVMRTRISNGKLSSLQLAGAEHLQEMRARNDDSIMLIGKNGPC